MSDLQELRRSASPRPAELVDRLARRSAPAYGFIAYGVLYFMVVVNTVVTGVTLGVGVLLVQVAGKPLPTWATAIVFVVLIAAFVAAWWPFGAWARRRRSELATLVRDGELLDARVVQASHRRLRGTPFTSGKFELFVDGRARQLAVSFAGHRHDLIEGAAQPILYHRLVRFAMAFPADGVAVTGRWKT